MNDSPIHLISMPPRSSQPSDNAVNNINNSNGVLNKSSSSTISTSQWNSGRAAWYSADGTARKPFIIGVTGGTASGKTTVCDEIVSRLSVPWVVMLSMDRFYKTPTAAQLRRIHEYNFDHPEAFDFEQMRHCLLELIEGRSVQLPKYNFVTHSRMEETDICYGSDVIIVEGILSLYDAKIRALMDLKVYVDTDDDIRLARRIKRDIAERGRTVEDVLQQYVRTVKPAFDEFISPTKRYADLILPRGGDNVIAINLLCEHIQRKLFERSLMNVSQPLMLMKQSDEMTTAPTSSPLMNSNHVNLLNGSERRRSVVIAHTTTKPSTKRTTTMNVLPSTVQILPRDAVMTHIHTTLRDRCTSQDEFQFTVHRLGRLVVAEALNYFYIQQPLQTVTTPTGSTFTAPALLDVDSLCCVSIVRGGEALEICVRDTLPSCVIGKIVIAQTSQREEGARLYYCKLPTNIAQRRVLLLDPTLSTGNAIIMALRVLLDHGVVEENIVVCCIAAAHIGLRCVSRAFPHVTIVTSWLDAELDERFFLKPGLGACGDRYYGTNTYDVNGEEANNETREQVSNSISNHSNGKS